MGAIAGLLKLLQSVFNFNTGPIWKRLYSFYFYGTQYHVLGL